MKFSRKVKLAVYVWIAAGIVINFLAMLYYKPWGPKLGVAESPLRIWRYLLFSFWVCKLPIVVLGFMVTIERPDWLAPPGKYVPGREYKVWSTYRLAAIALMAALFTACSVVSYTFFDLRAAPAAISCILFDPIVGFFTIGIGDILGSLLFAIGNPLIWTAGDAWWDGGTWIWLGIFYKWFAESKYGKSIVARSVFWVVVYVIWRTIYMYDWLIWWYPIPALWSMTTWFFTVFLPSGITASLLGVWASEATKRTLAKGR
ncbi:MAG: hypothetical protein DRN81_05840 [Thermoproteota archaeon]|nr:MAG: hypothetical protein DRN81_05840 [Candidatus Korarchaeota archaeon]